MRHPFTGVHLKGLQSVTEVRRGVYKDVWALKRWFTKRDVASRVDLKKEVYRSVTPLQARRLERGASTEAWQPLSVWSGGLPSRARKFTTRDKGVGGGVCRDVGDIGRY